MKIRNSYSPNSKKLSILLEKAGPVEKLLGDTAKKIVTIAEVEYEASLHMKFCFETAGRFENVMQIKDEFSKAGIIIVKILAEQRICRSAIYFTLDDCHS